MKVRGSGLTLTPTLALTLTLTPNPNPSPNPKQVGGSGSKRAMGGVTVGSETVRARYVVNAAGGASDKIAKMVGEG